MNIDINQVDGSCEEERKHQEDKVEENEKEENMTMEEKGNTENEAKDEDEENKEKGLGSMYSRSTKRRRVSVRENKLVSTQ